MFLLPMKPRRNYPIDTSESMGRGSEKKNNYQRLRRLWGRGDCARMIVGTMSQLS